MPWCIAFCMKQFSGNIESTIAEKPVLRDRRLILRRQPLTYLESTDPELLRYLELYLTQLHPEYRGLSWTEARKRIEAPATLEALHTFMTSIDNLNAEKQQIRTTINSLLWQIEDLVVLTYRDPADGNMMESISARMTHGTDRELF